MTEPKPDLPRLSAADETEVLSYHPVSPLAIAALLVGLASPLALFGQLAWFIPVAGALLAVAALRQIANDEGIIGRKAALAGLMLALLFGAAGPTRWAIVRYQARSEAQQFADYVFQFLRENQPLKAYQLTVKPGQRRSLEADLAAVYAADKDGVEMLKMMVNKPIVRALLTLGEKAQVRFYDTESQSEDDERQGVVQSYAVTYAGDDGPESFFVTLTMERSRATGTQRSFWQLVNIEGPMRPKRFR